MHRLNISAKIWLSVGAFILGAVLSSGLNQMQEHANRLSLRKTSEALFPAAQRSQEAQAAFVRMVKGYSDAVVVQDTSGLERAAEDGQQVVAALKEISNIPGLSAQRAEQAAKLAAAVSGIPGDAQTTYGSILRGVMTPETQEQVRALAGRIKETGKSLSLLKDELASDLHIQLSAMEKRSADQSRIALVFFVVTLGIAGVVASLMIRSIVRPLGIAVALVNQVAQGDLTRDMEVFSSDEVGKVMAALNKMIESMREVLREVRHSAQGLTLASQELASGCRTLSSGSHDSTASLQETSDSLQEITVTVKRNSDSAREASSLASAASASAIKGGTVIQSAITAMAEIHKSSHKIAEIISRIDEIAFQTNLLAVNAAIEAARAGDHGLGFAVVATEVRALAQNSTLAAKEIKNLILESVEKVECGSESVNHSEQTLQEIVASVKRAADVGKDISAACAEQASGIEQVNSAVSKMNRITQSSSEQTNRLTSTAQQMSQQAIELRELLGHFILPESSEERHAQPRQS